MMVGPGLIPSSLFDRVGSGSVVRSLSQYQYLNHIKCPPIRLTWPVRSSDCLVADEEIQVFGTPFCR